MRGHFQIPASIVAVFIALVVCVFSAHSQQRGAPTLPGGPAPAQRGQPGQGGQRGATLPGTETGWSTFQTRCASCHLNPSVDLATPGATLRLMTPEKIYEKLTTGSMKDKSEGINDATKR